MSAEEEDKHTSSPSITDESVDVPNIIELSSIPVEIAMHPAKDVLAAGTIDGPVKVYSYTADKSKSNQELFSFNYHKESCRAVHFSDSGDYLFSGSNEPTIYAIDFDAGAISRKLPIQHGAAIYSLLSIDNHLLASGDDDGQLIVWDFRRKLPFMSLKPCVEYISCLAVSSDKRTLLCSCGEGTISAFDLRSRRMEMQSELFAKEFLSIAILKKDTKVVVSASDGALNIFNWGEWENISDRYRCHDGSIDAIVPISDDILIAGCEDGFIRAVQIHPNRNVGILGIHDKVPVEGLSVSHDHQFVASCSYDCKVKFHALSVIRNADKQFHVKSSKEEENATVRSKDSDFFKELD